MAKLLEALSILAFVQMQILGSIAAPNPRIVGGSDAEPGQFPYQVSLQASYVPELHFCGGSVLSKRTILTAAHCVIYSEPNQISVHVGSNTLNPNGDKYEVEEILAHPEVDLGSKILHDIAVLYLKKDLEFSNFVQSIELETAILGEGLNATASGWGYTSYPDGEIPNVLQYFHTLTISNERCNDMYNGTHKIEPSHLCTLLRVGMGTCRRDSGGPLVRNGKQIGVVSFGDLCALGTPDVFGRISYEAEWIKSVTK